jgi:hypothetical protein
VQHTGIVLSSSLYSDMMFTDYRWVSRLDYNSAGASQ